MYRSSRYHQTTFLGDTLLELIGKSGWEYLVFAR